MFIPQTMSNCTSASQANTLGSPSWTCKFTHYISYAYYFTYFVFRILSCRFPMKYERFCAVYIANHVKNRNRRSGMPTWGDDDDSKTCPFNSADHYDADIHDALANMRRFDGSPLPHERYGPPVNFFAAKGCRKYWITKKTPALGLVP